MTWWRNVWKRSARRRVRPSLSWSHCSHYSHNRGRHLRYQFKRDAKWRKRWGRAKLRLGHWRRRIRQWVRGWNRWRVRESRWWWSREGKENSWKMSWKKGDRLLKNRRERSKSFPLKRVCKRSRLMNMRTNSREWSLSSKTSRNSKLKSWMKSMSSIVDSSLHQLN